MMITALLLAALCTPDVTRTPTPVVMWDTVNEATVIGYTVYYNEPGGTPQLSVDIPCEWLDMDNDDTVAEFKWCRGVNFGLALQKAMPSLLPLTLYEIRVKAYDARMVRSANYSNIVTVCMSAVCSSTARGVHTPCN